MSRIWRQVSTRDWLAEGARFEIPPVTETIGLDLFHSFQSPSLTEMSEVGEEPIKTDGAG
jgi:hypothetical protein